MKGKESKCHEKLQDGISIGSSRRRRKKIIQKPKKNGWIRAQRDLCWMRIVVEKIYKWKLSGYSKISLIILIGAAKWLRLARDLRGGGWWRSRKMENFWDQ